MWLVLQVTEYTAEGYNPEANQNPRGLPQSSDTGDSISVPCCVLHIPLLRPLPSSAIADGAGFLVSASATTMTTAGGVGSHAAHEGRILALEHLDAGLQCLHLLGGAEAELLGDLDKAPEPEDDDEGANLLGNAPRQRFDEEAAQNDGRVDTGEPRPEVSSFSIGHQRIFLASVAGRSIEPAHLNPNAQMHSASSTRKTLAMERPR